MGFANNVIPAWLLVSMQDDDGDTVERNSRLYRCMHTGVTFTITNLKAESGRWVAYGTTYEGHTLSSDKVRKAEKAWQNKELDDLSDGWRDT